MLGILLVFALAAFFVPRVPSPMWLEATVSWVGYTWMVVLLFTTIALLVMEPFRWILNRRITRQTSQDDAEEQTEVSAPGDEPNDASTSAGVSRRRALAGGMALTAGTIGLVTTGYGTYQAVKPPRVKGVEVPLSKLSRSGDGFRIALVSDIHLSAMAGRRHSEQIVDVINGTQADAIAVVGDLVDGTVEELGDAAAPLAHLRARQGAYFVTGNHEYYSGAAEWLDEIRNLGLRPLENTRTELTHFDLAGVDDVQAEEFDNGQSHGPDFQAALGDRDPNRASVLLAHQPVVIEDAMDWNVDLQLSGHTHGGQVWPGPLIAAGPNPTVAGLDRYGDTRLYVTRGAGTWGPRVRIGAPSDITVLTLRSR